MIRFILLAFTISFFLVSCSDTIDNTGTCHDGIKNHGEQETDCGGPCPNYCESCGDGIRNQGETAVDCGGPCDPCYPRLGASINGISWTSTSRNAFLTAPYALQLFGTSADGSSVTLHYSGPFSTGNVNAGNLFTGEFRDATGRLFTSASVGMIRFTTFDTIQKQVSGTFDFIANEQGTASVRQVTKGVFTVLEY